MKVLKGIFYTIITIIVLFMVIGLLLPKQQHVERSAVISASPETVYKMINNPRSFNQWSPWAKIDPKTEYTFTGPESGIGATMTWSSENPHVGSGNWTITEAIENEYTKMDLDFGNQGKASSSFDLVAAGDGTKITWGFDMDTGMNPMNRWFGLMLDKWIGADYEKGLADLKKLTESAQ